MEQEREILAAYSKTERHFYLMVLRCEKCNYGPFDFVSEETLTDKNIDIWYVRCRKCHRGKQLFFDRNYLKVENEDRNSLPVVNPSNEPSKLVDLGQWLAIFYAIIESAANEKNRILARRLGYEATLALEEAIKFYSPNEELPPPEAFWTEESKKRFREHPELFSKARLLRMREKLPKTNIIAQIINKLDDSKNTSGHKSSWWKKLFGKG